MSTKQSAEELLKAVEASHADFVSSLRALHEAISTGTASSTQTQTLLANPYSVSSPALGTRNGEASSSSPWLGPMPIPPSPRLGPSPFPPNPSDPTIGSTTRRRRGPTFDGPARRQTDTSETFERRSFTGLSIETPGGIKKHVPASLTDYGSDDDMAGGYLALTEKPKLPSLSAPAGVLQATRDQLPPEDFSDGDLIRHLKGINFTGKTETALQEYANSWKELTDVSSLEELATKEEEQFNSATFQVYGVRPDTSAAPRHEGDGDGEVNAMFAWDTLRRINPDGRSVGRITVLQEPSPIMLGSIHLTMGRHFDVDELLSHLVTDEHNKGKTRAVMLNRAFETDEQRQRSFFFVFKYYTVVGKDLRGHDLKPAPWQQYDSRPADKRAVDHIDIAECSSVLALSLGGPSTDVVRNRTRRGKVGGKREDGPLFDSFAPWHLLNIQCFPDYEHTPRNEESGRRNFPNGPYAFLDRLVDEYRDATKRNEILNERITGLITPPTRFMFDVHMRDKLLFEDDRFTYSRRYFWAFNTLGVINDGIKSMINAYRDTFTEAFWEGRHPHLWPHPAPDSDEGLEYRKQMAVLRNELERAIEELGGMYAKNERTRKEIVSLREQLFSGSSIRESRRAIEQGDNIKILTALSMIFLPLTFVTGVFGITEFHIDPQDWRFAVTMVCTCVPFILFVFMLQTRIGMKYFKKGMDRVDNWIHHLFEAGTGSGGGGQFGGGGPGSKPGDVPTPRRRMFRRQRRMTTRLPGATPPERPGGTGRGPPPSASGGAMPFGSGPPPRLVDVIHESGEIVPVLTGESESVGGVPGAPPMTGSAAPRSVTLSRGNSVEVAEQEKKRGVESVGVPAAPPRQSPSQAPPWTNRLWWRWRRRDGGTGSSLPTMNGEQV